MTIRFNPSNDVRAVCDGAILRVTIHRPEKRNPLSLGVLDELRQVFTDHAKDENISLAVLSASGDKAFASGGDLGELADYRSAEDGAALSRHGKAALDAIRYFPVPVVARVNGVALGGGAELALACDMRVATASARIGFIHSRLKIAPSWGGGIDLVRLVGPARATRMMARAEILGVHQAHDMGLIDLFSEDDESFDSVFDDYINSMSEQSPQVMRAIKSLTAVERTIGRSDADHHETMHFAKVWAHDDHWNAVASLERPKT